MDTGRWNLGQIQHRHPSFPSKSIGESLIILVTCTLWVVNANVQSDKHWILKTAHWPCLSRYDITITIICGIHVSGWQLDVAIPELELILEDYHNFHDFFLVQKTQKTDDLKLIMKNHWEVCVRFSLYSLYRHTFQNNFIYHSCFWFCITFIYISSFEKYLQSICL